MDFTKYVQYIINTELHRVPSDMFDEDWEPLGPLIRKDMYMAGLITMNRHGLLLTVQGKHLAAEQKP